MKIRGTTRAFTIGVLMGVLAGAAHGAAILLFFGFWAGLILPLAIFGSLIFSFVSVDNTR